MEEIDFKCKEITLVDIDKLHSHPKNDQIHKPDDELIDRLCTIFKSKQGYNTPIKADLKSKTITAGHARVAALKKLGVHNVPCVFIDYENEDIMYADVVADNALSEWRQLNRSQINVDLAELDGMNFDIDLLGIKDFVVEPMDKFADEKEDEVPETPAEPRSKTGDLIQLGEHRLLCGDCTDKSNVDKLMDGQKADMVFTDPPYGIDYSDMSSVNISDGKNKTFGNTYKKIKGDDQAFNADQLLKDFDYVKEVFMWGGDYYIGKKLISDGSLLVWDKRIGNQDNLPGSHFEICWSKQKHQRVLLRHVWVGVMAKEGKEKRIHPTQKSIELICDMFNRWGKQGDAVIDLFGGSGSTLIACEKTNRKCYMMEIDPHYIDVIIQRYCDYTKNYDIIVNGEKVTW